MILMLWLPAESHDRTATEVRHLIGRRGSLEALAELNRNDGGWPSVLAGISSGKPEWLAIAAELRPVSDGGASEDLAIAMQDALPLNPTGVLTLVDRQVFSVAVVCGNYGSGQIEDERPKTVILALVDKRIAKVSKLRGGVRKSTRLSCVDELRKLRRALVSGLP